MKTPRTRNNVDRLRIAVIFDQPDAWRVLAVWALSIQAGECKIGDEVHGKRLQNLTGLAVDDARRWAQILFNAQIAYANGEITQEATDYVRAKMQLETDPDSRRGATQ